MQNEQLTTQALGTLLRSLGYLTQNWIDSDDPLACLIPSGEQACSEQRGLDDLFLHGDEIRVDNAREALQSTELLDDLAAAGLVMIRAGLVQATITIVPVMGYLIATEHPLNTRVGVVLPHDYLSSYSTMLARYVRLRSPRGVAIDVGSGTGIQSMVLGESATRVLACDIDLSCCDRTRTTAWLNNRDVEVIQSDLLDTCPEGVSVVVSNPPWRIMPATIPYPARGSRVGVGWDGLDLVRRLVSSLPGRLSEQAECHLIFEAPSNSGPPSILEELLGLVGPHGFGIEAEIVRRTPIESVIRRSLQVVREYTGDEELADHDASLRACYRQLQTDALSLILLTLTRSPSVAGRIDLRK